MPKKLKRSFPWDIHVEFVDRIPKNCKHNKQYDTSVHYTNNPNNTSTQNWIERPSVKWRNMLRRKAAMMEDEATKPEEWADEWPDMYYVTVCDVCEAWRWNAWQSANWDLSPWDRRDRFATALSVLEVSPTLTEDDKENVLRLIKNFHLTVGDFWEIDGKPGQIGYKIEGREWHFKLQQVRNSKSSPLFDILRTNQEDDGYSDDDKVPDMPPNWWPEGDWYVTP